ncbi:ERF family protein [Paenibacillus illinoisensis]|uniref:ERF family protein n=1 Tax=Paenibacillus illinoisensis TaxID=59845 RepID=UPI002041DE08|nr:ERF family protein [Paenibacillus illinoisensis]MCM3208526.1 ERF family protein [Paenibacillus illinoisensis]
MIFSETRAEISKALVAAWGCIETPKHNSNVTVKTNNGSYDFSYTDLDGIFDAIKQVYKENKIAVLQEPKTFSDENGLMLSIETMLLHESGEWVKSEPLQVAASTKMQDLGGQITYLKRYSLSAISGLPTEKDDDGNGASGNSVQFNKRSAAQVKRLFAIARSKGVTEEEVKKALMKDYNKTQAEDLTKEEYDALCGRLESARKE